MDDSIHYEKAGTHDAPTLAAFRFAMFRDMRPEEDYQAIEASFLAEGERYYRDNVSAADEYTCVAKLGDRTVGCGSVMFQRRPPNVYRIVCVYAYVLSVYVLVECRGRGIATGIMEELLAEAKRRDAFRVSLHASDFGRHVYERLGFMVNDRYMELKL